MGNSILAEGLAEVQRLGKEGKYKEAFHLCTQLEKQFPGNADIFFLKGSAYYKAGDLNRARAQWEKAISVDPSHARSKKFLTQTTPQTNITQSPPTLSTTEEDSTSSIESTSGADIYSKTTNKFRTDNQSRSRKKTFNYHCVTARLVALILDGIIVAVPAALTNFLLPFVGGALLCLIYYSSFESSSRKGTLGKQIMGLNVVDSEGSQISFLRATGRFFGKVLSTAVCLLGYLLAPITKRRQALHDLIAGTLVIKTQGANIPLAAGVIVGGVIINTAAGIYLSSFIPVYQTQQTSSPAIVSPVEEEREQPSPPEQEEPVTTTDRAPSQNDPFGTNAILDQASVDTTPGFKLYQTEKEYTLIDQNAYGYDLSKLQVRYEGEMLVIFFPDYSGYQDYEYAVRVEHPIDPGRCKTEVYGKELRIIVPKK